MNYEKVVSSYRHVSTSTLCSFPALFSHPGQITRPEKAGARLEKKYLGSGRMRMHSFYVLEFQECSSYFLA